MLLEIVILLLLDSQLKSNNPETGKIRSNSVKSLNRLEQKLAPYAIKGLITYIIALNGIVFIINLFDQSGSFIYNLALNPAAVIAGQWWRLITFVFIPPTFSPLWLLFTLYFYYSVGINLEQAWGSFRFNLYYFTGMLGTIIASFISGGFGAPTYLNLSLFFAFARLYPDFELMLFLILPVKIKYLAWLNWFFFGFTILFLPWSLKLAALMALINYFLFFGKELATNSRQRHQVYRNRQRFQQQKGPAKATIHKCEICGKTEADDNDLEFRYCAECSGDHEYCMEHLKTHEHIKTVNTEPEP